MISNRVSRCRGISQKPNVFSPGAVELAYHLVKEMRPQFTDACKKPELWQGEVLVGRNVLSDERVVATLMSWATEKQFLDEPLTWVLDAFQDCAERDFFYANEKSWV